MRFNGCVIQGALGYRPPLGIPARGFGNELSCARQVSWLAGHHFNSSLPNAWHQWMMAIETHRLQLRGQLRHRYWVSHRIPF